MKIYNTLTRKKEEFIPIKDKSVGFYTCGPTVYDYPHIGNLRAYIFADLLHRWLEFSGFKVKHVVNITDVGHLVSDEDEGEDKLLKGAKREGKSAYEVAEKYTNVFINDLEKLNIEKADVYPKATEHINEQIEFIQKLEEREFTYATSDGIYFDTSKLKDYGKLAGLDIEGLKAGARVEVNPEKKNLTDFALWKFSPKDSKREMEWDSPWGKGFPGWHIECSAMSCAYLGEYFDIHSGGIDHIPVHHTNEIAQSEAVFGKPFVKYWVHNEFLLVDGRKMSKSLNNFYTLGNLKENFKVEPLAFRMLCLQAHYRDTLNFTAESITAAHIALSNLKLSVLRLLETETTLNTGIKIESLEAMLSSAEIEFIHAMNDDLNSPKGFAVVFKLLNTINIESENRYTKGDAKLIYSFLMNVDKIFGLGLDKIKIEDIPEKIQKIIDQREIARKEQNWTESDELRAQVEANGYEIEDTPDGPKVRKL